MTDKNGKVDWKTFLIILTISGSVLGILWSAIESARNDITDIKVNLAGVRSDLNNLVRRIDRGEITFEKNE